MVKLGTVTPDVGSVAVQNHFQIGTASHCCFPANAKDVNNWTTDNGVHGVQAILEQQLSDVFNRKDKNGNYWVDNYVKDCLGKASARKSSSKPLKSPVPCESDNTVSPNASPQPHKKNRIPPKRTTMVFVGRNQSILVKVKFGPGNVKEWKFGDYKGIEPKQTKTVNAPESGIVRLAVIFRNGSRSLLEISRDGEKHTCLFMNLNQRISITYGGEELKFSVNANTNTHATYKERNIEVEGKLAADDLFGNEKIRVIDRFYTADFDEIDREETVDNCPLAKYVV